MTRLSEALKRAQQNAAAPQIPSEEALPPSTTWKFAPVETMHVPVEPPLHAAPSAAAVESVAVDDRQFDIEVPDFAPAATASPASVPSARPAIKQPEPIHEPVLRVGDADRSKLVVGDGPLEASLRRRFPEAHFLGRRTGAELARCYAAADAFVFPSRTDTFGLVLLEALASGTPVAAYPVPGPVDVIGNSGAGALSEDLRAACLAALDIPSQRARARAEVFSWSASARQFLQHLCPLR